MISPQILWNMPIIATCIALVLLASGILLRKERLVLVSVALILSTANSAPVVSLTSDIGVGTASFLIGFVIFALMLYYRLDPVRIFLPRAGLLEIFLLLTVFYILFISPIVSIEPTQTIRRSLSYFLVYILGWRVFGMIFLKQPELNRSRIYTMLYTSGAWSIIFLVSTLIILGPLTFAQVGGDMHSVIKFGSYQGQRLQADFCNATGLSMAAATSIFLIIHWLQKCGRSILRQITLVAVLVIMVVVFIWSAGRTALLAFAGTVVLLLFSVMIVRRSKARFKAMLLLLLLGLAIVPLGDMLTGLFLRGGDSSLLDAFYHSRLNLAMEGIATYRSNLVWGTGTGILLGTFTKGDIAVESFFIRILIELGVIGGTIYLITWLMLTYFVIKVDLNYIRQKHPAAWLPSSGFIFIWLSSPASFGFSIFNGDLILHLAIASAAFVEWKRIQIKKRQSMIQKIKSVNEGGQDV